jgi:hypothetical protein
MRVRDGPKQQNIVTKSQEPITSRREVTGSYFKKARSILWTK